LFLLCFCLFWLQAEERGKWDVSSAGTLNRETRIWVLYICHDREAVVCNMKKQTNKPEARLIIPWYTGWRLIENAALKQKKKAYRGN
jgi:hypothetical protein